jgi:hypothetical protein
MLGPVGEADLFHLHPGSSRSVVSNCVSKIRPDGADRILTVMLARQMSACRGSLEHDLAC